MTSEAPADALHVSTTSRADAAPDAPVRANGQWTRLLLRSAVALAIAFLVGGIWAFALSRLGDWRNGLPWERTLLLSIDRSVPKAFDTLMLMLPWLGTNLTVMPIVLGVALWLWRKRGHAELALRLVVVTVGSLLLNAVLKGMFDRPRPALWPHRGQYQWAAYPSGHAIVTTSVLFTAALLLHRERGWRWPYVVASTILVVSLYSRLYLGVHWPTDVLGGIAIGLTWLAGSSWAFRRPVHQPRS